MSYICTKSFRSEAGNYYEVDQEISDWTYADLEPSDKEYFKKLHGESRSSGDDLADTVIDAVGIVSVISDIASLFSSDSSDSSSSSDSSFGGFDGGDSGGGGAGGDW